MPNDNEKTMKILKKSFEIRAILSMFMQIVSNIYCGDVANEKEITLWLVP
jgi:hypothetical protein